MRYIDWHCDTLTELKRTETLLHNKRHINLEGLQTGGVLVQCCAMFVPTGLLGVGLDRKVLPEPERRDRIASECKRIEAVYERELAAYPAVCRKILNKSDIDLCCADKKTGILLTIEDGGVLFGELARLGQFYAQGVRLITLTWNHENEIGYPNTDPKTDGGCGLKPFGVEVLEEMARCGMIADVSHLSDAGFLDVAAVMQRLGRPFVASHSNARAVAGHPRNLTDEMIQCLADCGGIAGLNFAPQFLNAAEPKNGESRISDMVRHVLHIYRVGGESVLSIGSDFDGIEGKLEIAGPKQMERLWEALHKAGLPESVLEKMWQKNARRVLEELL